MLFKSKIDEQIFQKEVEISGVGLEEYVLQRRKLELGLTDKERSRVQKGNWRKNKHKYLKAINKFHKSTEGKKFHKQLSRFVSTVPQDKMVYYYDSEKKAVASEKSAENIGGMLEWYEFLIGLTSAFTHALIEKRYFCGIDEAVEYNLFLEDFMDVYIDALKCLREGRVRDVDWEFVDMLLVKKEQVKDEDNGNNKEEDV